MDIDMPQDQPNGPPLHGTVCAALNVDAAFKVDEGYSEETRSMDSGDSAMGLEPRNSGSLSLQPDPLAALHNAVAALDEPQRSGA